MRTTGIGIEPMGGTSATPQYERPIWPIVPQKTLRDEFATAALQGLLANPADQYYLNDKLDTVEVKVKLAYVYADEMLKERDK